MQAKILLATTLLAAVASADNIMLHPQMRRDLEARATGTEKLEACESAILSAYSDVPTPPADVMSYVLDNPQTDACHFSVPASLKKDYSSYSSEVVSWYKDHSKEIDDALSQCPTYSNYATFADAESGCSTVAGDSDKSAATATATSGSDSADSTKSSSSSSQTTGAASHNTGMAAAALAAAGFVVALL